MKCQRDRKHRSSRHVNAHVDLLLADGLLVRLDVGGGSYALGMPRPDAHDAVTRARRELSISRRSDSPDRDGRMRDRLHVFAGLRPDPQRPVLGHARKLGLAVWRRRREDSEPVDEGRVTVEVDDALAAERPDDNGPIREMIRSAVVSGYCAVGGSSPVVTRARKSVAAGDLDDATDGVGVADELR